MGRSYTEHLTPRHGRSSLSPVTERWQDLSTVGLTVDCKSSRQRTCACSRAGRGAAARKGRERGSSNETGGFPLGDFAPSPCHREKRAPGDRCTGGVRDGAQAQPGSACLRGLRLAEREACARASASRDLTQRKGMELAPRPSPQSALESRVRCLAPACAHRKAQTP